MNEPSVNMIIRGKGLKLCVSSFWYNGYQHLTFVPITEDYKIDVKTIISGQTIQVFKKQDIMLHMKRNELKFINYIDWSKRVIGKKDIIVVGLDEIKQAVLDYEYKFMGL